jgi:hypothetical protein
MPLRIERSPRGRNRVLKFRSRQLTQDALANAVEHCRDAVAREKNAPQDGNL